MSGVQTMHYARYEDDAGEWHTALFGSEDALHTFIDAYSGHVENHKPVEMRYSYDPDRLRAAVEPAGGDQ